MIDLPPPIHLRDLPIGTRFMLMRTGQKFTLTSRTWLMGKVQYFVVLGDCGRTSTLHHSCHVKPLVRPMED